MHSQRNCRWGSSWRLRIRGVVEGTATHLFIPRLAELCRRGDPPPKLVTTFGFETSGEAWSAAKTGDAVNRLPDAALTALEIWDQVG